MNAEQQAELLAALPPELRDRITAMPARLRLLALRAWSGKRITPRRRVRQVKWHGAH